MATAPEFLPEKAHGPRSLSGLGPWGHKESDRIEHAFWKSLIKKQLGVGAGLVALHMKVLPEGESCGVSRNCLNLGGAVSPGSARPQMSKHQKPGK